MAQVLPRRIPASFVLARVFPTPAELALGFTKGFLEALDVVQIALGKMTAGCAISAGGRTGVATGGRLGASPELVRQLELSDEPAETRQRVWIFLVLDWLFPQRHDFEDPWKVTEAVFEAFDHPQEISSLVGYLPALPSDPPLSLDEKWLRYLERERRIYRMRNLEMVNR